MADNVYNFMDNGGSEGSNDNLSALHTLMNTVSAGGGGIVLIPNAALRFNSGTIEVPADVILQGAGRQNSVFTITGSPTLGNGAVALKGANSAIIGIQINITAGDYRRAVDFRGATDCRVENCGVNVTSTAVAGTFYGVYVANATAPDRAVVRGNDITGSTTAFNTYAWNGIHANNSFGCVITDNYVHDVTGTAINRLSWGIYASGDSDGCYIAGNRVWNCGSSGIQVNADIATGDEYGRRIVGNSVYNCDHIGLAVDSGTVQVTGNTVRQCEILLTTGSSSSNCAITGNTFMETEDGSGGSAIDADLPMVVLDGTYHAFTGNTLDVRGHSLVGIAIDGDYCTVSGNTLGATSPAVGIRARTASANNRVSGNSIGPSDDTSSNRRIWLSGTNNMASDNHIEVPNGSIGIRLGGVETHAFHNVMNGAATATTGVWLNGTNNYALYNITRGSFTNETDTTGATTPTSATHITY